MKVFVVLSILLASAIAAPSVSDIQQNFGQFIGNCLDNGDITTCLAVKGIAVLNRAARSSNIDIIPGITFVR